MLSYDKDGQPDRLNRSNLLELVHAERKMAGMQESVTTVQGEIKELQAERAKLLAQLERVEQSLAKAQARKVSAASYSIVSTSLMLPLRRPFDSARSHFLAH